MKVENMTNSKGNKVPNQFIITLNTGDANYAFNTQYFQSYHTIIAKKTLGNGRCIIYLDRNKWDCSKTTGRYRNQFLGESKAETQKKIDSGEYILTDLN
jgi:hypothetical protein